MHDLAASFVLGYHGCDESVAGRLLRGATFKPSHNDYDWLGHGIYFWEANPLRGLDFARESKTLGRNPRIRKPSVVGAVIGLGRCLDLTTSSGVRQIDNAYRRFAALVAQSGGRMPSNSADLLRRNLDCAVIEFLHEVRRSAGDIPIDSVKGVFVEGNPVYDGAGIYDKTHIQICVRNPERIKGAFRVPKSHLS